eukprot:6092607-Amphidinium_carterae.1
MQWSGCARQEMGKFDVICANIVVGPLCRSVSSIRRLLRAESCNTTVLLAGFRTGSQAEQVQEAYGLAFDLTTWESCNGWELVCAVPKESTTLTDPQ